MPGKEQIVAEIGDSLLPNLVNIALVANDRAKYLMTLLQTARGHAEHPEGPIVDLQAERLACGVPRSSFDRVVENSRKLERGVYRIPEVGQIQQQLVTDVETMLVRLEP